MSDPHELVMDKTGWPPGPWMDEPDRVQWRTEAGLPGLIVRSYNGALCGYVAVPLRHPAFGRGYDYPGIKVHGGLSYGNPCQEYGPICHVPEPGESDNVWWLGFDCAHLGDLVPKTDPLRALTELSDLLTQPTVPEDGAPEIYRDLAYVSAEVESLARQLARQL